MANAALNKTERTKEAEKFLSVAVWKSISFNSTSAKAGSSPRFRMRVFAKGCPRHALREVHELLAKSATVRDPVIDGVVQPGTFYHRGAGYLKDERTSEAGTATYTLVRDFFDGPVSESDTVEDGCGNKTSIRFEWDRDSVEDLATLANSLGGSGGVQPQGTVIRIAGVSRDPETNLFSYYVTVTETKTVIFPEYLLAEDAFSQEKEALWLGLYGDAANPVDSNTDAAPDPAVPSPGALAAGTTAQVSWSKNKDDCTLNAQARKRIAKSVPEAAVTCTKTLFEERDGTSAKAASSKLGHAPTPSGGKVTTHKSVLRPDRLWDNDKDENQEFPVSGARVSTEKTKFDETVTTVSKSQAKGSAPKASVSGGVITVPTVVKTPGDLLDVSVTVKRELPGARAATSAVDKFNEESVEEDVAAAALGAAPPASSGTTVQHVDRNTPGGLFSRRKVTRKEKPGSRGATYSKDKFGEEVSIEDVSATPLGAAPDAAAGVTETHTDNDTPGGLFSRRKITRTELPGDRAVTKSDNQFESVVSTTDVAADPLGDPPPAAAGVETDHRDQSTPGGLYQRVKTVKTDKPGGRAVTSSKTAYGTEDETVDVAAVSFGDAPAAADGVITTHAATSMPSGLVTRRMNVKRERTVVAASESVTVTPWATFKTVRDKSMAGKKVLPEGEYGRVENSLTPGSMYDRETTQLVPGSVKSGTILSHTKGGNRFMTEETIETIETVKNFGTTGLINAGVPGAAQIREVTFSYQEDGTYRKRVTTRTASPRIWIDAQYSYLDLNTNPSLPDVIVSVYHYQFLNVTPKEAQALLQEGVSGEGKANVRVSVSMKINEFGLYGGTFHRTVKQES